MKSTSGSARAELSEKSGGTSFRSIKKKLYVSFGGLILIFFLVSLGAIGSQLYLQNSVTNLLDTEIRFSELLKASESGLQTAQVLEHDFFANYRERGFEAAKAMLSEADDQFQAIHKNLLGIRQLNIGPGNIDKAEECDKTVSLYQSGLRTAVAIIEKRIAPDGPESQLRTAGQALEDFFHSRSMNAAGIQLMRMYEQRYLMGESKAGGILADTIAQIKNQMETARLSDGDGEQLNQLCTVYASALQKARNMDAQLQKTIADYRISDSKIRPMLLSLHAAATRAKNTAIADMKKLARITLGATAAAFLFVLVIGFGAAGQLARGITRQAQNIMGIFDKISIGDYSARAQVTSNDELGAMARSLNTMLDNIFELIQTREERNTMQASLMKLLDDVSGIADGDLSKEAEVTQDFTGAIADAFNFAIMQLRQIVHSVQDSTFKVGLSASEIASAAEKLAKENETTAARIVETAATVKEMALSARNVSENAIQSAAVSDQALDTAKQGAQAVLDTIDGMNRIRDRVQETAKRIKRLGESSQEIGDIVQMINDIADRTSILAMNASIQAAMSGESGRGFAVVAEEVERLAQRSAKATKQITELVKTIQSETSETVIAMEETTHEVVAGSDLANEAGQSLNQIETVSSTMADIIKSISQAAQNQARSSDEVAQKMNEISEATQQATAGVRQAAQSITSLARMAEDLRGSVNVFKLPDNEKPRLNA
ncbi:MAG: methyl-accepting chemotaxis protein [Deltaproteobacteria bacterium]|nr:methyl-accepting chemotaxis protein [Deltaproteobacteria bacterium]